jgi:hypothetical protein
LPPDGASYPQILRGPVVRVVALGSRRYFGPFALLLVTTVVSQALVMVFWATTAGDQPYRDYFTKAFAFELPTGMLAVNLGLATLIPIAWALMAMIHQMRPRWLSSVQPRIRWRYLFGCLGHRRGRAERRHAAVDDGWKALVYPDPAGLSGRSLR